MEEIKRQNAMAYAAFVEEAESDQGVRLSAWQRIESVVKASGMSINAFARFIGLTRAENLYQIKKGNNGVSRDLARRIIDHYPHINFSWLLTGAGTMTIDGSNPYGLPFYKCSCPADIDRVEADDPDGRVMLPGFEDCNVVVAHNWHGKDGISDGAYLFLQRVNSRYVRRGQYLVVTDKFTTICKVQTINPKHELELSGPTIPRGACVMTRIKVRGLYLIRGILNITAR